VAALPFREMMAALRADVHPPLYFAMLWAWIRLFGDGEASVRLLSGFLYLLTAGAVFGAARALFGRPAALACAIVFAASPLAVLTASLVRMYSLMTLLGTLSLWGFFALARKPSLATLLIYSLVNAAGLFTHVWFCFLLLAQAVVYLWVWRAEQIGWWIGAAALSCAPYAALWLPVMLRQLGGTSQTLAWVPAPTAGSLLETIGLQLGPAILVVPAAWWFKRSRPPGLAAVCLSIAAIAILAPIALSFWKPVFWARFTVVALPAVALAAGAVMATASHRAEIALALLACGLQLGLAATPRHCDPRWTAQWLAEHARPGDTVIYTNISRPAIDHYWDRIDATRRLEEFSFPREIDDHPGYAGQQGREALEAGAAEIASQQKEKPVGSRIFLLHGFRPEQDAIVLRRLSQALTPRPEQGHQCAGLNNYISRISVFENTR